MSFEIPNDPAAPVHAAAFADQAEPEKVDWDILVAALKGDGVISGCLVTAQATPDMTVAVASGTVIIAGVTATVSSGNVTITAADVTSPRFDLIVVNNSGVKSATPGSPNANPCSPAIPANSVVLAAVYVPAADTDIDANQVVDKRAILPVRYSVHQYIFTANGNMGDNIVVGDDQGNPYVSGPVDEIVTRIVSDCKTAPGTTAAVWQIEYVLTATGNAHEDRDVALTWQEIESFSHTAAHLTVIASSGFTVTVLPARRALRFNVDNIGGVAAKGVTVTMEVWRLLQV